MKTTTVKHVKPVKHVKHTAKPPKVRPKPATSTPILTTTPPPTIQPTTQAAPVAPGSVPPSGGSGGGLKIGHLLIILIPLLLLGLSIVPTRVVVLHGRFDPSRVASIKTGFAVAGISIGVGSLIALLLSKAA